MPPYRPGYMASRSFTGYNPYQEECWQAFDTVYHGYCFGFAETRQPTPGRTIDQTGYNTWKWKFDRAWEQEAKRENGTRGLTSAEMGDNVMQHLYERFTRAEALRPVITGYGHI